MSTWDLDPGHTRGRKKQKMNSVDLHWKMKNLLVLVIKDKKLEWYNVFATLEDIKRILRNQFFCLDRNGYHLAHVKGHIAHESKSEDLANPPSSRERVPAIVASSDND